MAGRLTAQERYGRVMLGIAHDGGLPTRKSAPDAHIP